MSTNTTAQIDLASLRHNFKKIKSLAPQAKVLAIIKDDAYRHGSIKIANTLSELNADAFGVATIEEALLLKKLKLKQSIVLLKGFLNQQELKLIDQYQLDTVIHSPEQLIILNNYPLQNLLNVWFKIDTGMHRLGFLPNQVPAAYTTLLQNPKINKPLRIMSHFANADDKTSGKNIEQLQKFQELAENLDGEKCLANSGAILNFANTHFDWIRPGITLYGASPILHSSGIALGFKPVMSLISNLIAVKYLKKGATVGYGSTWQCPENMPIGIVNTGYGDGYPWHIKPETPILVNDIRCKIIGRVAMDMINVDLRNCPNAKFGDRVTLWGKNLPIETIAQSATTIPYEIFCHITNRVKFVYTDTDTP